MWSSLKVRYSLVWYLLFFLTDTCDLNLRISEDGTKANPINVEDFALMWSGARANYGVKKGKVGFEVKVSGSESVYLRSGIYLILKQFQCFDEV